MPIFSFVIYEYNSFLRLAAQLLNTLLFVMLKGVSLGISFQSLTMVSAFIVQLYLFFNQYITK